MSGGARSGLRERAWWVRTFVTARGLASDRESFRVFRQVSRPGARRGKARPVRVRPLGGATLFLRPGTTDAGVAWAALTGGYHLPPAPLSEPRLIWDLGANIGVTIAHFAHLYPSARIVGVELEEENARLARRNTDAWRDRCEILEGAVWPEPGPVRFDTRSERENSLRVADSGDGRAEGLPLNDLLERFGAPDYVKMDIEGAEERVLTEATEWASEVRSIAVECHGSFTLDRCAVQLGTLGFRVHPLDRPGNLSCVVGTR